MLSRVADSMYWISRYVERAENLARFVDVNMLLMLDLPAGSPEQWAPLVHVTGDFKLFKQKYGTPTKSSVIEFLTFDKQYPHSIYSCLRSARENARSIREIIASEMWEHLNRCYLMVQDAAARGTAAIESSNEFFTEVKMASHLFAGITDNIFTRGEGWHFYRLGRLLERADKTSRLLDVKYFYLLPSAADVGSPLDEIQWAAVLRSASAFEMYRKRHGRLSHDNITQFLLLDREFPRAVHFCIARVEESLHGISGSSPGSFSNTAEQLAGQLRAELAYARASDIMNQGLHEFLDGLQTRLNGVGDAIHDTYFALQPTPTQG